MAFLTFPRRTVKEPKSVARKALRPDIQGLRAVAVALVLLYHAGVPWLPGGFVGVDVFFVISGFLITGGIVKELRRDGKLSLRGFYARRIARIVPASIVAVLGTLLLTWMLLPQTRWAAIGQDALAGLLYFINWSFASSSVDYLAQGQAPSPFQHFWSLAVEEQFYIVWPLLLLSITWLSLKLGFKLQKGLISGVAMVALPSLLWSVYYTSTHPGSAYFATTTRMWELAIGAGLAVISSRTSMKVPTAVSASIGWAGLAAIALAATLFTSSTTFPSFTALLPVLGAAALIWAGTGASKGGPELLLGLRPMVAVGNVSYSLYLWHWPMLVIAAAVWGTLQPMVGLLVVAVALVPAWLSLKYVEQPIQVAIKEARTKSTPFSSGFLMTGTASVCALLLILAVPPTPPASAVEFIPEPLAGTVAKAIGAETLLEQPMPSAAEDKFADIQPNVLQASKDLHPVNDNGCMQKIESSEAKSCQYGAANGSKTIALVGDSHAAMLLPGFERVATDNGWRLVTLTKGACPWVDASINYQGRPFRQCSDWNDGVTQALLAETPDVIVTVTSRYLTNDGQVDSQDLSNERMVAGMRSAWAPFIAQGVPIISVRDTPRPGSPVPDCVAQNLDELSKCSMPASSVLSTDPPEVAAATGHDGASVMDLTPAVCFADVCPAVIGGVLVYRDDNHLTATYARSMHKHIASALKPFV